jgi:hypothetical protein
MVKNSVLLELVVGPLEEENVTVLESTLVRNWESSVDASKISSDSDR